MGKRYGEKRDGAKIEDILSRLHYIDTIKEFQESRQAWRFGPQSFPDGLDSIDFPPEGIEIVVAVVALI